MLLDLSQSGAEALAEYMRRKVGADKRPGIVVSIATAGDLLQWHVHLHVLGTDGAFSDDVTLHSLATWDAEALMRLFDRWQRGDEASAAASCLAVGDRCSFGVKEGAEGIENSRIPLASVMWSYGRRVLCVATTSEPHFSLLSTHTLINRVMWSSLPAARGKGYEERCAPPFL